MSMDINIFIGSGSQKDTFHHADDKKSDCNLWISP